MYLSVSIACMVLCVGMFLGNLTDCCGLISGRARGILSRVWCLVGWHGQRAVWCCWPVDGTTAQLSVQCLRSRRVFPVPAAVSGVKGAPRGCCQAMRAVVGVFAR